MIEKIDFYHLVVPLKKPYHLSFKELHDFDIFIAAIHEGNSMALGETAPLPGYSSETPEQVWLFGKEMAPRLIGRDMEAAREMLEPHIKSQSFAVTPFLTALEGINGKQDMTLQDVELVGILSTGDHEQIRRELPEIIEKGFNTIKVKVGIDDVGHDIDKVNFVLSLKPAHVKIRVDANQGYNYDQARRFVKGVNPDGIELFEQPFPKGVWNEMEGLSRISPVPLMLDESINTEDDLMRTIELKCSAYVKFKLMKAGSMENLVRLINTARAAGLGIVLGNGVAGEIGCYHEAVAAAAVGLANAGEMNGFLKLRESVLVRPLLFDSGKIKGDRLFRPELDFEKLNRYLVAQASWEC